DMSKRIGDGTRFLITETWSSASDRFDSLALAGESSGASLEGRIWLSWGSDMPLWTGGTGGGGHEGCVWDMGVGSGVFPSDCWFRSSSSCWTRLVSASVSAFASARLVTRM